MLKHFTVSIHKIFQNPDEIGHHHFPFNVYVLTATTGTIITINIASESMADEWGCCVGGGKIFLFSLRRFCCVEGDLNKIVFQQTTLHNIFPLLLERNMFRVYYHDHDAMAYIE